MALSQQSLDVVAWTGLLSACAAAKRWDVALQMGCRWGFHLLGGLLGISWHQFSSLADIGFLILPTKSYFSEGLKPPTSNEHGINMGE